MLGKNTRVSISPEAFKETVYRNNLNILMITDPCSLDFIGVSNRTIYLGLEYESFTVNTLQKLSKIFDLRDFVTDTEFLDNFYSETNPYNFDEESSENDQLMNKGKKFSISPEKFRDQLIVHDVTVAEICYHRSPKYLGVSQGTIYKGLRERELTHTTLKKLSKMFDLRKFVTDEEYLENFYSNRQNNDEANDINDVNCINITPNEVLNRIKSTKDICTTLQENGHLFSEDTYIVIKENLSFIEGFIIGKFGNI